jgi:hypothetical protein
MRSVLFILTRHADPLAHDLAERQRRAPDATVEIFDLTQPEPDYQALLDKVFAADSVQVW